MQTRRQTARAPAHLRGISLIETCVAMAITAIVASAAAPAMQGLVDGRRLDGAATQLATDIQYVRTEAVARNQPVRLSLHHVGTGSDTCYVIHTGSADDCECTSSTGPAVCTGDAQQIKTVVLPADRHIVVQANVGSLLFDPLHGTSSPSGTLRVIGPQGRSVNHMVNVMGRVRSCSPQGGVAGYRAC